MFRLGSGDLALLRPGTRPPTIQRIRSPSWARPRPRPSGSTPSGFPHDWCIEHEGTAPVVHVYELDVPTKAYMAAGIFRTPSSVPSLSRSGWM
ncbi:hypothetical protein GCM10022221_62400 [Actinocorallia aurea]